MPVPRSPVGSVSSDSQSDLSQAPTPNDSEVFDFGVQTNYEQHDPSKKKIKRRSSSLSRFFSRGRQRKPLFKPLVKGKQPISCFKCFYHLLSK